MVEADDVEATRAGKPPSIDVALGIDQEPRLRFSEVRRRKEIDDAIGTAEENAAAFARRCIPPMCDERVEQLAGHLHAHGEPPRPSAEPARCERGGQVATGSSGMS